MSSAVKTSPKLPSQPPPIFSALNTVIAANFNNANFSQFANLGSHPRSNIIVDFLGFIPLFLAAFDSDGDDFVSHHHVMTDDYTIVPT